MKHLIVIIILFQSIMLCGCIRGRYLILYNSTPEPLSVEMYKQHRNTLNPPGTWSPILSQSITPREEQEIGAVIASTNTLYKIEASNPQGHVIYRDVFDYNTHKTFSIRPSLQIDLYDMRLEPIQ